VTPGDVFTDRSFDPFCERGVLAAIYELADFSHSKAMADLVTAGKWKSEMLIALGKVGLPRYANFIGRYKDDPEPEVRRAVATGLGLIDNDAVSIPVLIQLLTRAAPGDFIVRWEASESLVRLAKRKAAETVRRRLFELTQETDQMTVALAARALALAGDARGVPKLRDLTRAAETNVRQEAVLALAAVTDKGSKDVLVRRLTDESLAVRACAIFALGQLGDPALAPVLRQALQTSLEYEGELERRKQRGESEQMLAEKYGFGVFDLRQTLEQALATTAPKPR